MVNDTKEQKKKDEQQVEQQIEEEFNALLTDYLASNHRRKIEIITKAFNFANHAHKGVERQSGEPYILHPLAVARIVCKEMGLGSTSICSALLHDVVEDTDYSVEDIRNVFGNKIAQIVDGLTKISGGIFGDKASAQAENFRKLLLTMSDDIRVILIKIADRLHNMRTLGSLLPAKQYKIAGETLYLYAPLAHRLGLFTIKTELEDLGFKYEHPEDYKYLNGKLAETTPTRIHIYENFAAPLREHLDAMNIKYEMKDRLKSVYSIWSKMKTKGVTFEEIYDIFAVRIIFESLPEVDEKKRCWDIYSVITDLYRLRPDRIRDWVSRPKANGYQALHVTVMGPDGRWIEVQIRSSKMDEIAEKGFAAHWKYKEHSIEEDTELDKWLETIQEILENPNPNALDFLDMIKLNLFAAEIFVFTPKGDIKTLPQGATALDFAYELHTNIGNQCIGAKVNHKLVPLSHKMNSGDQVEILTSRSQSPKPEWLNFVTTAKARTKIEVALRKQRREDIKKGEEIIDEFLKNSDIVHDISILDKITAYFDFEKREELYHAVATHLVELPDNAKKLLKGKKSAGVFLRYMKQAYNVALRKQEEHKEVLPEIVENPDEIDIKKTYILRGTGTTRNYAVAECCHPIPGDDVMGFLNDDKRMIVHKRSCPIAIKLQSSFGKRIISCEWASSPALSFPATIEIRGIDSMGILNQITQAITNCSVNVRKISLESKDGLFEGKIEIFVHDAEDVQRLSNIILKLKGVKTVNRVG
ncbi:MAG: RelA/SpoT family protein [Dysgonamonadaceae bacterium]|jgi:GTP pyrophosphokinase|nr:RelA/SpoT family protein [Dysgonamonadaceae bacterium]